MRIRVSLNKNSIDNAQRQLKKAKEQIKKMLDEFYYECYEFFVARANEKLSLSEIGSLVKEDIQTSWEFVKTANGAKFVNSSDKSVYVEFGVGIVGEANPHPNAEETSYEYDKDSPYKTWDRSWYFYTNSNELDLPLSALTDIRGYDDHRGNKGKRLIVGTQGTKGVWYAFNALEDLRAELPKIWLKVKQKYWR